MEFAWSGVSRDYKSKIAVIIAIVIVLSIIGYFTGNKYLYRGTEPVAYSYTPNNLDYIVANANTDNDGDGIENWKENLLNTDPNSANRLPMLTDASSTNTAGGVSNNTSKNNSSNNSSSTEVNLTYEVAKSLYASANSMRAAGDTTTPTMMTVTNAIADQALSQKVMQIDESKIIISGDTSRDALKTYGNLLLGYIIYYNPKVNIASVLDKYLKNNDKKVLADIQSNIDLLVLMRDGIYKTKVPKNAYELHVATLKYIEKNISICKTLMKVDSDSLAAMVAFKEYRALNDDKTILKEYKKFFDANNVVFGPKDPGSLLNQI